MYGATFVITVADGFFCATVYNTLTIRSRWAMRDRIWSIDINLFLLRPWSTFVDAAVKLKFHQTSFLVASLWHSRWHAGHTRHPREDVTRMSAVSGDFPVQLAMRLPDWSAGSLLRCSATRLSVRRVVLRIPRARHARLVGDIVARMSRGCYEETALSEWKSLWRRAIRRQSTRGHLTIRLKTEISACMRSVIAAL